MHTHRMEQHGGKRARAGRKTEVFDRTKRVTLTLDPRTVRLLRILGEGNASRGARRAADVAYDRYLKT